MLEKCFKGFIIPPLADTPEGREAVREGHQGARDYCFLSEVKCMTQECIGAKRSCDRCIACSNDGDARRKREAFEEYDRRYPVEGAMPELKSGMIVEMCDGAFLHLVSAGGDLLAEIVFPTEPGRYGVRRREPLIPDCVAPDFVARVWAPPRQRGYFTCPEICSALRGALVTCIVWKKPTPAKEMTVDEISKALGYKVKVVGSEKADD